jgi:hypothetical protein
MLEYLDKAWTVWTGGDIVQVVVTGVVVVIVVIFVYSVIKAATAPKKDGGP